MAERLRILVVDDNEDFCKNLVDILKLKGYEVMAASDGFKALEMVQRDGFDVVLMDFRMPMMDGVETFKRMKAMGPHPPVILLSAYAVEDLIKEGLREGAFGFLKKPPDLDRLFTIIEHAIPNGALLLVVDDDRDLCANLEDVLSDKGYRVNVAHDGDVAMGKAWEKDYEIMLIDLKLPPLNGLEAYLHIRDIRPNLVAIIITGYRQELGDLVQQFMEKSAYICLDKPVDIEGLISLLDRITQQKARGILKKPE